MVSVEPSLEPYLGILFVIALVGAIAGVMLVLAHLVRPARKGPVKDSTYESGMPTIGDARGRFNIRFYIVAMLFLLFDVEVVFLWPWAKVFHEAATNDTVISLPGGTMMGAGFMLAVMGVFFFFLLVGYAYEWRKDAFEWD